MSVVTHVVSFKYKPSVSSAERHLFGSSFLALKDTCLDKTGQPYILSLTGGSNNSPEGHTKGLEVS